MSSQQLAKPQTGDVPSLEVLSDSEIEAMTVTVDVVPDKPGIRGWIPTIIFGALVAIAVAGVVLTEQKEMIAVWAVILMLILMFMKVPVAIALAAPGLLGLYEVIGWRVVETSMTTVTFQTVASWSLSVLPMFIFMGLLLSASGLTRRENSSTESGCFSASAAMSPNCWSEGAVSGGGGGCCAATGRATHPRKRAAASLDFAFPLILHAPEPDTVRQNG